LEITNPVAQVFSQPETPLQIPSVFTSPNDFLGQADVEGAEETPLEMPKINFSKAAVENECKDKADEIESALIIPVINFDR
jgi:hypothetical protein